MAKHVLPEGYLEGDVDAAAADAGSEATPDGTDSDGATDSAGAVAEEPQRRWSRLRLATIAGLVVVVALAGLTGWLGRQAWQAQQAGEQREQYVEAGRLGALNLTSVDWQQADADVQRILESATGQFYDQFEQRAAPYTEVVKQAQSKSIGTVQQAGLESVSDDGLSAQVLVAMSIAASNAGAPDQPLRFWRMRLTVEEIEGQMKVSVVDFVQ